MKQIVAIIKPYLAERVVEAVRKGPIEAVTVREVKGYGRQKGQLDQYDETEYSLAFLPKVEISVWVEDTRVEETITRLSEAAHTGRMGDGKIMVLPVARAVQMIEIGKPAT